MLFFRTLLTLAAATLALANPLIARQATNKNAQIGPILDDLSKDSRLIMFQISKSKASFLGTRGEMKCQFFFIDTMQANGTATDGTVGVQVQQMITNFNSASSAINAIGPSAGSTTVQPTNIELSRTLGETLQYVIFFLLFAFSERKVLGLPCLIF